MQYLVQRYPDGFTRKLNRHVITHLFDHLNPLLSQTSPTTKVSMRKGLTEQKEFSLKFDMTAKYTCANRNQRVCIAWNCELPRKLHIRCVLSNKSITNYREKDWLSHCNSKYSWEKNPNTFEEKNSWQANLGQTVYLTIFFSKAWNVKIASFAARWLIVKFYM